MEETDHNNGTVDEVKIITEFYQRIPGSAKGLIWIAPDFDAPLPDERLDAFEGTFHESTVAQGDKHAATPKL